MNAISVQQDATFDITNDRLIILRILLRALFSVFLTLPIGFSTYTHFFETLWGSEPTPSEITLNAFLLLLPFILGYSTSLVIMILNHFLDAIQTFFGHRGGEAPGASPSPSKAAPPSSMPATGAPEPRAS